MVSSYFAHLICTAVSVCRLHHVYFELLLPEKHFTDRIHVPKPMIMITPAAASILCITFLGKVSGSQPSNEFMPTYQLHCTIQLSIGMAYSNFNKIFLIRYIVCLYNCAVSPVSNANTCLLKFQLQLCCSHYSGAIGYRRTETLWNTYLSAMNFHTRSV